MECGGSTPLCLARGAGRAGNSLGGSHDALAATGRPTAPLGWKAASSRRTPKPRRWRGKDGPSRSPSPPYHERVCRLQMCGDFFVTSAPATGTQGLRAKEVVPGHRFRVPGGLPHRRLLQPPKPGTRNLEPLARTPCRHPASTIQMPLHLLHPVAPCPLAPSPRRPQDGVRPRSQGRARLPPSPPPTTIDLPTRFPPSPLPLQRCMPPKNPGRCFVTSAPATGTPGLRAKRVVPGCRFRVPGGLPTRHLLRPPKPGTRNLEPLSALGAHPSTVTTMHAPRKSGSALCNKRAGDGDSRTYGGESGSGCQVPGSGRTPDATSSPTPET